MERISEICFTEKILRASVNDKEITRKIRPTCIHRALKA